MTQATKLTPAQRAALTTIKAGGVVYYEAKFGRSSVSVPEGAKPISVVMIRRLLDIKLCNYGQRQRGSVWGTHYTLLISTRGADALAGTMRPPVIAKTVVTHKSGDGPWLVVTTEIDPYEWARWDGNPAEQEYRLKRISERVIAEQITAVTHIET